MSAVAIRVHNLSKCYRIRHSKGASNGDGFRHVIHDAICAPLRSLHARLHPHNFGSSPRSPSALHSSPAPAQEDFWALKDLSFEVKRGEVLGIIGRNGAGKSTLLKILSRITEPSSGAIGINGHVASLLEVGTGFHPELTGRENIYLNGTILGMTRAEIRRKFAAIVAFAEVQNFLDTPVKRYSSGMYVRLAFAVAAHLDPEILIVDEVLAVGDAEFQKKCLGTMQDLAEGGRTILFVSHNMSAISKLCTRALCLNHGSLVADGSVASVIEQYLQAAEAGIAKVSWQDLSQAPGNERIRITDIEIQAAGEIRSEVKTSDIVIISIGFQILASVMKASAYVILLDQMGTEVLYSLNLPSATVEPDPMVLSPLKRGPYRTECFLPADFLNEQRYFVKVGFNSNLTNHEFRTNEVISFCTLKTAAMRSEYHGAWPGVVRPKLRWRTTSLAADKSMAIQL